MVKVALIGFGIVGQAFIETIRDKKEMLNDTYGLEVKIVAINGRSKGSVYEPLGLD